MPLVFFSNCAAPTKTNKFWGRFLSVSLNFRREKERTRGKKRPFVFIQSRNRRSFRSDLEDFKDSKSHATLFLMMTTTARGHFFCTQLLLKLTFKFSFYVMYIRIQHAALDVITAPRRGRGRRRGNDNRFNHDRRERERDGRFRDDAVDVRRDVGERERDSDFIREWSRREP